MGCLQDLAAGQASSGAVERQTFTAGRGKGETAEEGAEHRGGEGMPRKGNFHLVQPGERDGVWGYSCPQRLPARTPRIGNPHPPTPNEPVATFASLNSPTTTSSGPGSKDCLSQALTRHAGRGCCADSIPGRPGPAHAAYWLPARSPAPPRRPGFRRQGRGVCRLPRWLRRRRGRCRPLR